VFEIGADLLRKRLVRPRPLPFTDVAARVDHEPVEPGRELRFAAELADPHAELGECLLSGVAGVLGVGEQVTGEAFDLCRMTLAKRLERPLVAVLCSFDQDRIA